MTEAPKKPKILRRMSIVKSDIEVVLWDDGEIDFCIEGQTVSITLDDFDVIRRFVGEPK